MFKLAILDNRAHKRVIHPHGKIRTLRLALHRLSLDERLHLRMPDGYAQHQRTTPSVTHHLPGRIGISLHERDNPRRNAYGFPLLRTLGAYLGQVMPHATTSSHQLHLFLIHLHDGSVRLHGTVRSYHETIGKGSRPILVTKTGHRTSLKHNIFEMAEQIEQGIRPHRVRILSLNPSHLLRHPTMHIIRGFLIDVP